MPEYKIFSIFKILVLSLKTETQNNLVSTISNLHQYFSNHICIIEEKE